MKLTLHTFHPVTKAPTRQTIEVELKEDLVKKMGNPGLLTAKDLWLKIGKKYPVAGSVWAPPDGDDVVFDGLGWNAKPNVEQIADSCFTNEVYQDFGVSYAKEVGLLPELVKELSARANAKVAEPESSYSRAEQDTWSLQYEEARLIVDGDEGNATPLLSAIAKAEERDLLELAESVISKAESHRQAQLAYLVEANTRRQQLRTIRELASNANSLELAANQLIALLTP